MAGAGRWILGVIGLAGAAALTALPAPAFRSIWLTDSRLAWIGSHKEGLEYTSYLAEILLILMFGGLVFATSFGERVRAAADRYAGLNEERLRELTGEAVAYGNVLAELMNRLRSGKRVSLHQAKTALDALLWGRNITNNPFNWLRVLAFVAAKAIPGGAYGALALFLFLVKCIADLGMMALPG